MRLHPPLRLLFPPSQSPVPSSPIPAHMTTSSHFLPSGTVCDADDAYRRSPALAVTLSQAAASRSLRQVSTLYTDHVYLICY